MKFGGETREDVVNVGVEKILNMTILSHFQKVEVIREETLNFFVKNVTGRNPTILDKFYPIQNNLVYLFILDFK